jgi:hypothetical protein
MGGDQAEKERRRDMRAMSYRFPECVRRENSFPKPLSSLSFSHSPQKPGEGAIDRAGDCSSATTTETDQIEVKTKAKAVSSEITRTTR